MRIPLIVVIGLIAGASLQPIIAAEEPPAGGVLVLQQDRLGQLAVTQNELIESSVVSVSGMPFAQAARIATFARPKHGYDLQYSVPLPDVALRKGDIVYLEAWVRCLSSADESGSGNLTIIHQSETKPRAFFTRRLISFGNEWEKKYWTYEVGATMAPDESLLALQFGFLPQVIEVGGIRVIKYDESFAPAIFPHQRNSYSGREADAPWRAAARERIRRHRMSDLQVRVVDTSGQAIPDAQVHVEMQRHEYGFGTAVDLGQFGKTDADGQRYRDFIAENFNKVVLNRGLRPGTWGAWTDPKLAQIRPVAFAWMAEHRIPLRGHYLVWAPLNGDPNGRLRSDATALRKSIFDHIAAMRDETVGHIAEWDAVNHIVGWGARVSDLLGGESFYADVIRYSRELYPRSEMWVNEGQVLPSGDRVDEYYRVCKYLIDQGAAPDGIGFMGHFSESKLTSPETLYRVIEKFATLGTKLQLTEFDVTILEDDPQLQADYLRDVMTVAYSHPSMVGTVMWGFWAGAHWKPVAALWNKDWSPRPAGTAWLNLVKREWWTDEIVMTDAEGRVSVKCTHGDYLVSVQAAGLLATQRVSVTRGGRELTIILSVEARD